MDQDRYKKSPIGLSYPITGGNSGYFRQDLDTIEVAKSSILLLLGTMKGERRMNPTYGSGLWEYLFNNIDNISDSIVIDIITRDVSEWLPDISIKTINTKQKNVGRDTYRIELIIEFTSNSAKDTLETVKFSTDILKT